MRLEHTGAPGKTGKEPAVPKKIAVVAFEKLASDDGSRVARCPVGGTVFNTCALPQNAEALVQESFPPEDWRNRASLPSSRPTRAIPFIGK